ncbi:phospholipase A and acyltransferase 5 [Urocitellus parryii]
MGQESQFRGWKPRTVSSAAFSPLTFRTRSLPASLSPRAFAATVYCALRSGTTPLCPSASIVPRRACPSATIPRLRGSRLADWELAWSVVPCEAWGPAGPQPRNGPEPGCEGYVVKDVIEQSFREKSVINVETTPTQKSIELDSTRKPEREGKLIKQAAEIKPRPRPGDLIEIFRIGYEHWAIYVEDDYVVHLAPPSEEFEVGSITSVFSNRAVVKYSRLQDVLHGCSWKINNKLDGTYLPLPVDKIIQRTKNMINKIVQYSLIEGNCEHFVNDLRYGVHRSQQVEHALMNGAKAAGAVISAVVDSIRPKPLTA